MDPNILNRILPDFSSGGSVIGQIFERIAALFREEESSWYDAYIPEAITRYRVILLIGFVAFMYFVQYYPRQWNRKLDSLQIDRKVEQIKKMYIGIQIKYVIMFNINFGEDKKVPIGAFKSGTDFEKLQKGIELIKVGVPKEIKFTAEMTAYIEPFLDELTGGEGLPDDLDAQDMLGLMSLFADYLQEKEPIRGKKPQKGEIMFPQYLDKETDQLMACIMKLEYLEKELKKLDNSVTVEGTEGSQTLKFVARKGKIEEIKAALIELETIFRKRSDECLCLASLDDGNMSDEKQSVPSVSYHADTEKLADSDESDSSITSPMRPSNEPLPEELNKSALTSEPCFIDPSLFSSASSSCLSSAVGIIPRLASDPCLYDPSVFTSPSASGLSTAADQDKHIVPRLASDPCLYDPAVFTSPSASGLSSATEQEKK